jgi:hypothetical protein
MDGMDTRRLGVPIRRLTRRPCACGVRLTAVCPCLWGFGPHRLREPPLGGSRDGHRTDARDRSEILRTVLPEPRCEIRATGESVPSRIHHEGHEEHEGRVAAMPVHRSRNLEPKPGVLLSGPSRAAIRPAGPSSCALLLRVLRTLRGEIRIAGARAGPGRTGSASAWSRFFSHGGQGGHGGRVAKPLPCRVSPCGRELGSGPIPLRGLALPLPLLTPHARVGCEALGGPSVPLCLHENPSGSPLRMPGLGRTGPVLAGCAWPRLRWAPNGRERSIGDPYDPAVSRRDATDQ